MKKGIINKNNPYIFNLNQSPGSITTPNIKNTKLLSPSTKEWPNSVYNFNKSSIESSHFKLQMINKIIRSYFNLVKTKKNNKNSKRMRDLIRRSSTKKLFVSKSEIKQYPEKVIYTMYVFNREKNIYSKKIFLLNKSFNKLSKYKMHEINKLNNLHDKLQLNKIRPLNRLGTINYSINNKLEQVNKSYLLESKNKNFVTKNLFLHKLSKGIIYYINSYNIIKRKPLLELKAKKLNKNRIYSSYLKRLKILRKSKSFSYLKRLYKKIDTIKYNLFIKNKKNINSTLVPLKPKLNKKVWKSPFRNKLLKGFSKNKIWKNSNNKIWKSLSNNKATTFFQDKLFDLLPLSFKKKQLSTFKSIFFFNFVRWVLAIFKIRVTVNDNKVTIAGNYKRYLIDNDKTNTLTLRNYYLSSYFYKKSIEKLKLVKFRIKKIDSILIKVNQVKNRALNKTLLNKVNLKLTKLAQTKLNKLNTKLKLLHKIRLRLLAKIKLNKLNKLNNILFNLLILILEKGKLYETTKQDTLPDSKLNISIQSYLEFLFKEFKDKYLLRALRKNFKKQLLGMRYLYRYSLFSFKYNKFLTGLKTILLRIFNKSPQINIVNLKYLHLNSDILMESVSIKLKNKKAKLLKTIKRALKLVKLPENVKKDDKIENKTKLMNISYNYNDKLQDVINLSLINMFSQNNDELDNKEKSVNTKRLNSLTNTGSINEIKEIYKKKQNKLNNLRYKWITGIRIEGKGRLTKRYRADRSVFKLKHKGSLKNINFKDIYDKKHLSLKKTQSMVMLKNQTTPNIQYTFTKWKRHVGSYGIKGWISNN